MGSACDKAEQVTEEEAKSVLDLNCSVRAIAEYIRDGRAKNIVVMVGAGVSVSAGIPDFRTPGTGLYDNLQKYDLPSPQAVFEIGYFKEQPSAFYQLAKEMWPGQYRPTPAHYFIRLLHEKGLLSRCFTQNIDSLEGEAGIPKDKIVAAHGNFDTATCITTGKSVPIQEVKEAVAAGTWQELKEKYGGLVKPDIVFFGEGLPERYGTLRQKDLPKADLLIVMGTSLKVQPFASTMNDVGKCVPRLLINRELVGERLTEEQVGFRFDTPDNYRDTAMLTDCDNGVTVLAELLGWGDDLRQLIESETKEAPAAARDLEALADRQWRTANRLQATISRDESGAARLQVQWEVDRWATAEAEAESETQAPEMERGFVACYTADAAAAVRDGAGTPMAPGAGEWSMAPICADAATKAGAVTLDLPGADAEGATFEVWFVAPNGAVLAKLGPLVMDADRELGQPLSLEEQIAKLNIGGR